MRSPNLVPLGRGPASGPHAPLGGVDDQRLHELPPPGRRGHDGRDRLRTAAKGQDEHVGVEGNGGILALQCDLSGRRSDAVAAEARRPALAVPGLCRGPPGPLRGAPPALPAAGGPEDRAFRTHPERDPPRPPGSAMNLSRWSLRNPITAGMVLLSVVVLGALSAPRLPLAFLPEVEFPGLEINIPYPNSLPAQVEEETPRPAEAAPSTRSRVRPT